MVNLKIIAFIGLGAFVGCRSSIEPVTNLSPRPRDVSDIVGDWVSFSNGHFYRLTITELGVGTIIDPSGNRCAFWRARMMPTGYELLVDSGQTNSLEITKMIVIPSLRFMDARIKAKRYSDEVQFLPVTNVVNQMLKLEIR